MPVDKDYWQQELEEIWHECHDCKYLIEDEILLDEGDDDFYLLNTLYYLRCEHFYEIDKDEVTSKYCKTKKMED